MTTAQPPTRRRRVRRALFALLVFPVTYLVLANTLIGTGLLSTRLSSNPDDIVIKWQRAWSLWPGRVQVRGYYMRRQDPLRQWELTVDKAHVGVDLLALLTKRFRTTWVDATGVEFRLRPRVTPDQEAAGDTAPHPPIRGFEHSLLPVPPPQPAPPLRSVADHPKPWEVQLEGVQVNAVRQIWIGPFRGAIDADVAGRLEALESAILVGAVDLKLRTGAVALGKHWVATDLTGELQASAAVLHLLNLPGAQMLKQFDLQGTLVGKLDPPAALNRYLPGAYEAGHASFNLTARLANGFFKNGSRLEITGDELAVRVPGYTFRGDWHLLGRVEEDKDGLSRLLLSAEASPFTLTDERRHHRFETPDVEASARGRNEFLGWLPNDWHVEARLTRSAPFPLSFLDGDVAGSHLKFTSGDATVDARLSLGPEGTDTHGSFVVRSDAFSASFGRRIIRGGALLNGVLSGFEQAPLSVDFSGSSLTLGHIVVVGADAVTPDWTGKATLDSAVVSLAPARRIKAQLTGDFSDARPFLAFIGEDSGLPHWVLGFLSAVGLHANVDLSYANGRVRLRNIEADGESLHLRGQMDITTEIASALLLLTAHGFTVGLDVQDGVLDKKIWQPTAWFEKELGRRD